MFTIKLFLSIIPIVIIALAMYKIDIEKEPKKVLKQIFISSMIIGLIGGLGSYYLTNFLDSLQLNSLVVYNIIRYVFIVALIEEICKFIPAKFIGMKSKYHTSFYDTLLYFVFAGLGFACIENIMYVMSFTVKTAFVRGILSVPGHILFSVVLGLFIALANREKLKNDNKSNDKSIILTTLGFTVASITHALFNYALTIKLGFIKALIVTLLYLVGMYLIFIIKETSRTNNFFIKDDVFKLVLNLKYIKANKSILGVISSMIIILGLLNTFSVYTFVEDYIFIKYLLIFIHFVFIILIIYNKKLKDKIKQIDVVKMTITGITFFCSCFLVVKYLEHNQMSYGYYLIFLGIILQVIYYSLTYIKINNKVKEPVKEEVKEIEVKEEIQDNDMDPEII
ncbi:MAG: PrsW family intramembrane metalloprotease [Bacilli bacterium]|nr:PrsW family intramembrane metalloprotease [Bacilli bacterium]